MSGYSVCQSCGAKRSDHWSVTQAEFHVGSVRNWKVQLCPACTDRVERALLLALDAASAGTEEP